jgi:hypothetical protein
MFLVTDKENKTFGDFSWSDNVENETDNPNHYFRLYHSLDSALYLSPFFNNQTDINIWEAEGNGESSQGEYFTAFSKVKVTSLKEFSNPTNQNRIVVAILCCLNLVKNQDFLNWCSNYLKNQEHIKENAFLLKESISDTDDESECFSCAIPLLSAVLNEEKAIEYLAASTFRSLSDSIDIGNPIDLDKIFRINRLVNPEDIASTLF